jgi:S-formylglutathione hydrolase FrmB
MRPGGKDGKLYRIHFGDAIPGGAAVTLPAGFYKIVSRAAAGSGFPEPSSDMVALGYKSLGPGNVYFAEADQALADGDTVRPMALNVISFVTDVQDSSQKQSHDVTTQADVDSGTRSYIPGAFQERTGTISGVVDVDSIEQRELFNEYREIVYQDGINVGVAPAKSLEHEYMMSRRETPESGETAMWEYMPLISESIQAPKPMDGVQSFSFNYKIDGQRKPCAIYREIA